MSDTGTELAALARDIDVIRDRVNWVIGTWDQPAAVQPKPPDLCQDCGDLAVVYWPQLPGMWCRAHAPSDPGWQPGDPK